MEKLSMCRICLSADTGLQSISGTHLQEMYEFLTTMLLVTGDSRPSLLCDLCCSRLETCHELRRQSLRSEELFTQLLRHKVQVNLQVMANMHPSLEDVMQTTADMLDNDDVNQEDAEDDVAVEQDNAEPIVKEEPDDVDTGAPRLAAQKYHNATLLNSLKRTDQTMDKVEEQKRETRRAVEDKPVEKNKIVETGDEIDITLHHNKRNSSISNHSDAHKEMFEISAEQSVNSSSSDILTPLLGDTCQKCFRLKVSLIRHIRAHTGKIPYQGDVCKKCFILKNKLVTHMRTHTAEKPFECNVCKKGFAQKRTLDMHIMCTHTGEKRYECNVCKKCFSAKCSLGRHKRTHTGEKPYKCNVCRKCFTYKSYLDTHIRTHTDEKPYGCKVCKKCYISQSHLDRHMHTHTREKPYHCNVCKKCFIQKNDLGTHMRTHTYAYIELLENKISDLECKSRSSSVEIRNIPLQKTETTDCLINIVSNIGKTVGVPVVDSDIRDIYRMPGKNSNITTPHPIIAEFKNVQTKQKLLTAFQMYNNNKQIEDKLNTELIGMEMKCQPVYLDEKLPPSRKRLFYRARDFAKRHAYNFCWVANGDIFLRKLGGDTPIKISSESSLHTLESSST